MARELRPCKKCIRNFRVEPNPKCAACISLNPEIYENLERLEEWRKVQAERKRRRTLNLKQRLAIGKFKGGYRALTPEDQKLCDQMTATYVARAKAKGKDVSTPSKRSPYFLGAMSWLKSRRFREQRREKAVNTARARSQDRFFRRIDLAKREEEAGIYEKRKMSRAGKVKHTLVL